MARSTKLILTLSLSAFVLATLCLTGQAQQPNKISTSGDIELYEADAKIKLTSVSFPLFNPGETGKHAKRFFIKNTGDHAAHVAWAITESSITWTPAAKHQASGYVHTEGTSVKYSLRVRQLQKSHDGYLQPEKPSLTLNPGKAAELQFELAYSGKPNTPETFTLTATFTATTPTKPAPPKPNPAFAVFTHRTITQNWLKQLLTQP